jgi:hypothetical protein|tara:strand:- start:1152 stop:1268 length:117 start_codon:yes stop_codon:yes gene_type:complete
MENTEQNEKETDFKKMKFPSISSGFFEKGVEVVGDEVK